MGRTLFFPMRLGRSPSLPEVWGLGAATFRVSYPSPIIPRHPSQNPPPLPFPPSPAVGPCSGAATLRSAAWDEKHRCDPDPLRFSLSPRVLVCLCVCVCVDCL